MLRKHSKILLGYTGCVDNTFDLAVEIEEKKSAIVHYFLEKGKVVSADFFARLENNRAGNLIATLVFSEDSTLVRIFSRDGEEFHITDEESPRERTKAFVEYIMSLSFKKLENLPRSDKE